MSTETNTDNKPEETLGSNLPASGTGITGLGGIFIYSEKPAELAEWYKTILEMPVVYQEAGKYWSIIYGYNRIENGKPMRTVWSILNAKGRPKPVGSPYGINYRVKNLQAFVAGLREKGQICEDVSTYPGIGSFSNLNDPDGNKIELWEDDEVVD